MDRVLRGQGTAGAAAEIVPVASKLQEDGCARAEAEAGFHQEPMRADGADVFRRARVTEDEAARSVLGASNRQVASNLQVVSNRQVASNHQVA